MPLRRRSLRSQATAVGASGPGLDVGDPDGVDRAVERERCPIAVVEGYRRSHVPADVERLRCGEERGHGSLDPSPSDLGAVDAEVTVTVRDAAGSPVGTATITRMHSHVVAPGGISFGLVEMDDTELPERAVLDFTVAPTDVPEGEDHVVDLPIVEFDCPDTTIRAVVGNDRDAPVGYAEVWVACFDDAGALTHTDAGHTSPVQIQPGETGTAEIECPVYLLSSVAEY